MRRHQVMKEDHCGCFEVGLARERIPARGVPVVVAVDECERPACARLAEAHDRSGALFRNEVGRGPSSGGPDHLLELAPPVCAREERLDDMERRNPRRDEVGGRPAAPSSNLDSAFPFERTRIGEEDRGLVAIDEADGWIASVDAKRMIDLLAEIGPGGDALVSFDHVRKEMIENWGFEIGGDVVVGHGWTWSKGTKRQRLRSILCDAGNFSCCAPYVVANGMLRG